MKTKTELDEIFDYPPDEEFAMYDNENFALAVFFSIPFIGWAALLAVIIYEWLWYKLRFVRLFLLIVWREIF